MKRIILLVFFFWSIFSIAHSQKLGLGIPTPEALLHIKGNDNLSQLIIDANNVQSNETAPLIRLRNSSGNDLIWIHSDHESNTFVGWGTGRINSSYGSPKLGNTFIGSRTGFNNNSGEYNTGVGRATLEQNQGGDYNTAMGLSALYLNIAANYNSALGHGALYSITDFFNTGCGLNALYNTTFSNYNLAVGANAGWQYDNGWNNVFFGAEADAAAPGFYNMVAFGNIATCTDVSQARIGNSSTYSIGGTEDWTNISDGRFKYNVKDDVPGLEFINKLRTVTYNLAVTELSAFLNEDRGHELNAQMIEAISHKEQDVQCGFIAQEVEAAARSVGYDFSGVDAPRNEMSLYGLRYAEFVVPLVKAVQELQQKLERIKEENIELKELELELADLKEIFSELNSEKQ